MLKAEDRSLRYCVVGAGAAGLAAAKNLAAVGIGVDVFEKEDDVGGLWNYGRRDSPVYQSVHLISSKLRTQFADFPMPAHFPDYPHHAQVCEYLRAYATRFQLYPLVQFGTSVTRIESDGAGWLVALSDGSCRRYGGVVICSGFLWDPNYPNYPGEFDGQALHSRDYKTPETVAGQRVLVVGAGNSGCDIAVECAQNAARAFLSVRRGYHYIPKYMFGMPTDELAEWGLKWRLPLGIRRAINRALLALVAGRPEQFGLPRPDHKLLESHPIINSQVFYEIGHGRLQPKPDVRALDGNSIIFQDGTREQIDVIIYATGYKATVPYADDRILKVSDNQPRFYLHLLHPTYDNLAIIGMIHPDSGAWWLFDEQAKLVAKFAHTLRAAPERAAKLQRLKRGPQPDLGAGTRYLATARHRTEVEHASYARRLRSLSRQLS